MFEEEDFGECEECGESLEFEYDDPLGLLCDRCLEDREAMMKMQDFDLYELGGEG